MIQPEPGGNCLNWVLGHLVHSFEGLLARLGRERTLEEGALERYGRGSEPLTDPDEAWKLGELLDAWDHVCEAMERGLQELTDEKLEEPAPSTPNLEEEEGTLRSFLNFFLFHQAYHAGQTGLLRRLAGKEGAIS